MIVTVVNPNTTAAMTEMIGRAARAVAAPGTVVRAVTPAMGPASVESHYDEALAAPGVLAEVAEGERSGSDGYVIACFGDPALDAARELARGPVVGIAEAAMHAAALLGRGFSVVTSLSRTAGRARELADRYGAGRFCRGVHAVELPVLHLGQEGASGPGVESGVAADVGARPESRDRDDPVVARCRAAVEADGSDVVVLGCAALAPRARRLAAELGVPVVDGVAAGTLLVQALVTMGLSTSRRGEYRPPPPKPYAGLLAGFALPGALPGLVAAQDGSS